MHRVLTRPLPRLAATLALAVPAVLFATGTAQAETVPGCASAFQIGNTAFIVEGGQTFASVKQFYGCGVNWGYIYVWQGWRNTHSSWSMCVGVGDNTTHQLDGLMCGDSRLGQVEVWSTPANTANDCTVAIGNDYDSEATAATNQVC
jgi:hypothetical protein